MRLLFLGLLLLGFSCGTDTFKDYKEIEDASPDIKKHIEVVDATVDSINKSADDTIKEADNIKSVAATITDKVPKESKNIDASADKIKGYQNDIKTKSKELEISNQNLINAEARVAELEKQDDEKTAEIKKLREDIKKERDAKKAALFKGLMYLIILSVILGAICVVCAIRGEAKAMWGAAVCGAVIVISLGISFYSTQLALVGAVALVAGLVLVGWSAYSEYVSRKATKELVDTVEVAKEKMDTNAKKEVFGSGAITGHAHTLQSNSTKSLVNKLRVKSKKYWEPTISKAGA